MPTCNTPYDGIIHDYGGEVFDVKNCTFGAVGNGTANDTAAVQAAIAAAQAAGGGIVYFPPGTYKLATVSSPTAPTLSVTSDNVYLVGAGPASTLDFHPTGLAQACIEFVSVNGGGVANLRVVHNGSKAVNRVAVSLTGANGYCVALRDCTRCTVVGNHLQWGANGVALLNTVDVDSSTVWTTNRDHTVSHNFVKEQAGYGIHCSHASGCRILGNHVEGTSSEGFKFDGRNHAMNICGNYVRGTGRDGMDFFDGLTESTIVGNTAYDTLAFGFELKGTFGGTWGSGTVDDYVFRDNTFSGNSAILNRVAGISVTGVRNVTLTGNNVVSTGPLVVLGTDRLTTSSWTKAGTATAAASTARAPDDSFTADTVSGTGTAGNWVYSSSGLAPATEYTVTAWLKGSGTTQLVIYDNVLGAQTSTVTLISTFAQYSFTATTDPAATTVRAGVGNFNAGTAASVDVWGARITADASVTAYDDLTDPAWTRAGTATVSANDQTAPNGTATADTLKTIAGTGNWAYYSRHMDAETAYTLTVWLKGSGTTQLVVYDNVTGAQTSTVTLTSTFARYSFTAYTGIGATTIRVGFGNYDAGTATEVSAWGMQVLSVGHGIQVTNCQGVALVGNNVSKCAGHGILWQSSARGSMTGNNTIDNSYVDGVVQNGAYDGVSVDATSTVFATGGRSCNGLVTNHKGGQGYGLYAASGSASAVWGGDYSTNLVGSIPVTTGNYVAGVKNNGSVFVGPYLSSTPSSPVDGSPCFVLAPRVSLKSAALATGATPSVAAANHFVTANTVSTTITDFTSGVACQPLVIEAGATDTFTSIANNANIATRSGAAIGPLAVGQMVTLQRNSANTKWVEV
jgi:parallel beta-helix repeat protein